MDSSRPAVARIVDTGYSEKRNLKSGQRDALGDFAVIPAGLGERGDTGDLVLSLCKE